MPVTFHPYESDQYELRGTEIATRGKGGVIRHTFQHPIRGICCFIVFAGGHESGWIPLAEIEPLPE